MVRNKDIWIEGHILAVDITIIVKMYGKITDVKITGFDSY